jgi:transcription factor E2F3
VDKLIKDIQTELSQMARDPSYGEFAYLTFDDIVQLNSESNDTLIAVKAPLGSKIEIPDPEELFEYFNKLGQTPD